MSESLIAQQKMIKTPPLLVMSKIKNYRTSSTHMTVCQCNWPISWPPPHWPPGRAGKKNGRHIWPNYDIKNFFQKKFKCTPCPPFWTVTSTLVPLEHSRKKQNVGYTDATIGCSLKQPKNCPDWLPFIELKSYLQTVNINKQKVLHNHYPEIQLNKYDHYNVSVTYENSQEVIMKESKLYDVLKIVPSTLKTTSALWGWLKNNCFIIFPTSSLRYVPILGFRNSWSVCLFTHMVSSSSKNVKIIYEQTCRTCDWMKLNTSIS